MRKIVLLLCLFAGITIKAQSSAPPSNVIKVSGGLDFVTSKMYLPDYSGSRTGIKSNSWQPGVSALIEYEHFWKSGWGFGVNLLYNDTRYNIDGDRMSASAALRSVYIGPSLVYSGCFKDHWRVECGYGMGYGFLGGDLAENDGFGMMFKAGIEYMVTPHFGVGVELNELVVYTKEDDYTEEFKRLYPGESNFKSGMSRLGLAAGVRLYF